jgi:glycosyltransferase involved in cell wall biosynthesis
MRIALVSSGLVPLPPTKGGAVEEYVCQLVKHLRRFGVDAVAIDARWDGNSIEVESINDVEIVKLPVKPPQINFKRNIIMELMFGRAVSKYLKNRKDFDIVHANTAFVGYSLAMNINRTYRYVYTCHNPLWPEEKVYLSEKIIRLIEGYTMRASDIVVALNKTMYKAIINKAGVKKYKVIIVPNGVDIDFFKPGLNKDYILAKFGLEQQNYVLFVGRIIPGKGVHLLLKAFKQVINELTYRIKLVVVGPFTRSFTSNDISTYAKVLMKYAEKELRGRVVFTGPVDRNVLRILYSNAYCLVLPSFTEAFPMVLLEAMASGIPLIGSTAGGIPDIIIDGVNGLLFRKGDWRDLAEKLSTLLNDKDLRNKLAINARNIAEKLYSWEIIAFKLKNYYRALM